MAGSYAGSALQDSEKYKLRIASLHRVIFGDIKDQQVIWFNRMRSALPIGEYALATQDDGVKGRAGRVVLSDTLAGFSVNRSSRACSSTNSGSE